MQILQNAVKRNFSQMLKDYNLMFIAITVRPWDMRPLGVRTSERYTVLNCVQKHLRYADFLQIFANFG